MVKVGDKIEILRQNGSTCPYAVGATCIVLCNVGDRVYIGDTSHVGDTCPCGKHKYVLGLGDYKIINNSIIMTIKEKFALAFKSEPEKTFRKAGITNGDDFLTVDGQSMFLSWLLKKNGNDFKKEVVDDLVKEEEKS